MAAGAKGKYTPEIVKEISAYIEQGKSNRDACALSDICEDTFYDWQKLHPEFFEAVKKAHANYKSKLVAILHKAAYDDKEKEVRSWQAAAWLLERKYKDEFSLRSEVTGKDGEGLVIKFESKKDLDQLNEIAGID